MAALSPVERLVVLAGKIFFFQLETPQTLSGPTKKGTTSTGPLKTRPQTTDAGGVAVAGAKPSTSR